MGALLNELEKEEYWESTYIRMMNKESFNINQKAEIISLYENKYHREVITQIKEGRFNWGICEKLALNKIGTTKKRIVYIYSIKDRYILGGLYRAFSHYFKGEISSNVFSYKKGVRTVSAIEYLMDDSELMKKAGVKLDISSYFNSVSREYLTKMINELTEGEPEIRKVLDGLLFDDRVMYRGKEIVEYKSLIAGTAFSSFLANYCLKDIDTFVADKLNLTYARYSDDIILFADTVKELEDGIEFIGNKLAESGLKINESKYEWFEPGDTITFLGLQLTDRKIDVAPNSAKKFKKKIKHACVYGRREIEINGKDPYKVAIKVLKRFNYRVYKCYIQDESKFGWAYYAFRYINCTDTIRELDFYLKDRIRQMITGKNNSANITKVSNEKLKELGYVSLCEMYSKFKFDFDMYCDTVDLMRT